MSLEAATVRVRETAKSRPAGGGWLVSSRHVLTCVGEGDLALALLYGCGLSRAEAASLDLVDVDAESGTVTARRW